MSSDDPEDPARPIASGRPFAGDGAPSMDSADAGEWWVDRFVLHMARESMLWGLLLVVLAHIAAFIASAGLTAARTLHPFAIAISLLLVGITAWGILAEVRRKGRAAGLSWLLLATWLMSGVLAYFGYRYDFL